MNGTTAVKERPILFSGEMVRAILDGRKTQTRRVVNRKHLPFVESLLGGLLDGKWNQRPMPYGRPGDRLWVREAHTISNGGDAIYRVDYPANAEARGLENIPPESEVRWRPSIHMPRWASRITLEITDVRVERVRSISRDDAMAEGVERVPAPIMAAAWRDYRGGPADWVTDPVRSFSGLWDSINAGRGYGWDTNPWVWVIEFRRMLPESNSTRNEAGRR